MSLREFRLIGVTLLLLCCGSVAYGQQADDIKANDSMRQERVQDA